MLSLDTFHQLRAAQGQQALAAAAELPLTDARLLADLTTLRRTFSSELAAAAVELVRLRRHAAKKFSRAEQMYFTREALEQASGELVARHRVARYRPLSSPVIDVCCSIGGDTLELAQVGLALQGYDIDSLRIAMAEANAEAYGVQQRVSFRIADAQTIDVPGNALVFFDPARRRDSRSGGRTRVWRPDDYEPPLSLIDGWLERVAGLGVKVAPGIDYDALPYDCEVEIVSVGGEVKEACLWFGKLRRHGRSATLLPSGATLHDQAVPSVAAVEPRRYLYEPDGAVIRAHLVEQLAQQLAAAKIDDDIAFLTSNTLTQTPFARAFEVHEVLPFNLKQLRARLRELDVGRVVIKKRGSPIDPQVLEQQLRLRGPHELTLILTHVLGRPSVLLGVPVDAGAAR